MNNRRTNTYVADTALQSKTPLIRMNMRSVYERKSKVYILLKRFFDVLVAGLAFVVLLPVMALTALAVVLESGFPFIYAAPRKGKDGKPFRMYKFRSMHQDAEEQQSVLVENMQTGAAFKAKDDPRITRVGRFIRKYFIDELPQLVNVVKGDMSLVGPRAIQQTREYTSHEAQRLIVQPGLTCYWQTSGNMRMPWEEWIELDLDYIEDMSIVTDLSIIAKTFGVILRGEGGY